jgi:hypothetical protein
MIALTASGSGKLQSLKHSADLAREPGLSSVSIAASPWCWPQPSPVCYHAESEPRSQGRDDRHDPEERRPFNWQCGVSGRTLLCASQGDRPPPAPASAPACTTPLPGPPGPTGRLSDRRHSLVSLSRPGPLPSQEPLQSGARALDRAAFEWQSKQAIQPRSHPRPDRRSLRLTPTRASPDSPVPRPCASTAGCHAHIRVSA